MDKASALAGLLRHLGGILGLLSMDPDDFLQGGVSLEQGAGLKNEDIDALIAQRLEARAQKNWAEADRIRGVLADAGVVLEDTGGQTTWRRA